MVSPRAHCLPGHIISIQGHVVSQGILSLGQVVSGVHCLGGILSWGRLSSGQVVSMAVCFRGTDSTGHIVFRVDCLQGGLSRGGLSQGRLSRGTMSPHR